MQNGEKICLLRGSQFNKLFCRKGISIQGLTGTVLTVPRQQLLAVGGSGLDIHSGQKVQDFWIYLHVLHIN